MPEHYPHANQCAQMRASLRHMDSFAAPRVLERLLSELRREAATLGLEDFFSENRSSSFGAGYLTRRTSRWLEKGMPGCREAYDLLLDASSHLDMRFYEDWLVGRLFKKQPLDPLFFVEVSFELYVPIPEEDKHTCLLLGMYHETQEVVKEKSFSCPIRR